MDEWVRVAANIVRDYPTKFVLDQRLGKVTTHFQETVHEIVSEGWKNNLLFISFKVLYESEFLDALNAVI